MRRWLPELLSRPQSGRFSGTGRRKRESILLAVLALVALGRMRFGFQPVSLLAGEAVLGLLFAAASMVSSRSYLSGWLRKAAIGGLVVTPLMAAGAGAFLGSVPAYEVLALTTLGTVSLALAIGSEDRARKKCPTPFVQSTRRAGSRQKGSDTYFPPTAEATRGQSLSVVTSGFTMLFTTAISDAPHSVALAVIWVTVCVWHLVANQWERLGLCQARGIRRDATGVRLWVVAGTAILCLAVTASIANRVPASKRLAWGFMPTSGGSGWSESNARSGVGLGDAAVAATEHAESFGAVDSDLFLESTESTLFDMFSESIGQPRIRNKKVEARQGLAPEKRPHAHHRTSTTDKGGDSFTTDRHRPKVRQPLEDRRAADLMQWVGPTGVRLAVRRYDAFDGVHWRNTADHRRDHLAAHKSGQQIWFVPPGRGQPAASGEVTAAALKVIRPRSARVPAPALTFAMRIKDISRRDFFGVESDGSFRLEGRDNIPPLTIIHLAIDRVSEDELRKPNVFAAAEKRPRGTAGSTRAARLAELWSRDDSRPYAKIRSVIRRLREDFVFDRRTAPAGDDPLAEFLTRRRGGDHLFATAAAVMLRSLGFKVRIATGYYVPTSTLDLAAGHTPIREKDVHVWPEVGLADGRWIAVEPTPGYREPVYAASFWLRAKRFAIAAWPAILVGILGSLLAWRTRRLWVELWVRPAWWIAGILRPRLQIRILMKLLEIRAVLAGRRRPPGVAQRDWILSLTRGDPRLVESARALCDEADRVTFGGLDPRTGWRQEAGCVLRALTASQLLRIRAESRSAAGSTLS